MTSKQEDFVRRHSGNGFTCEVSHITDSGKLRCTVESNKYKTEYMIGKNGHREVLSAIEK